MPVYSIDYDLKRPGQNYQGLWAELGKFAGIRILYSTWLVSTSLSAQAVYDRLSPHIDKSDRMIVIRVARDYQGWLDEVHWDWMNQHVRVIRSRDDECRAARAARPCPQPATAAELRFSGERHLAAFVGRPRHGPICSIVHAMTIDLPAIWVDASGLEQALAAHGGAHEAPVGDVTFHFPVGCKVMIDAAVRLLSLLNQLDVCTRRVVLEFDEGEAGAMGYLDRMGFFDWLAPPVEVHPYRPAVSAAEAFRGRNRGLVEIAAIGPQARDQELPNRLTSVLVEACSDRQDVEALGGAAWLIFAELVDNIYSHSQTRLDGFAALQVYPRGNGLKVAVSDSGLGIMDTLRPSLQNQHPSLSRLSDLDLLVQIFRQGVSRHGSHRGCGLKGAAAKAVKFNARLDVRLPRIRVQLTPGLNGYRQSKAHFFEGLPLMWGTHICFFFQLDSPRPNLVQ